MNRIEVKWFRKQIELVIRLFIVINTIGTPLSSVAQKEKNIWYFGDHAGIDFNVTPPVHLENSAMFQVEGCDVVSDENGNLLFYSNGTEIYTKNHELMQNGSGLLGFVSTTQSCLIVQQPETPNIYWVFTMFYQGNPDGLNYSIVDMKLNNGLGAVTTKNKFLYGPCSEKLTALQHSNGKDIWIVTHEYGSNSFLSFLLSNSGINNTPIISSVGPSIDQFNYETDFSTIGYLKASADYTKLAAINFLNDNQLYDFDNSTGVLSNPITLLSHATITTFVPAALRFSTYGGEFSKTGNFFYLTLNDVNGEHIYQYDLTASNIPATKIEIATGPSQPGHFWSGLSRGPDGKIYLAVCYDSYLAVINSPDLAGSLCDFNSNGVFLGSKLSMAGLPQSTNLKYWYSEETVVEMPNVFTPNSDETNDYCVPIKLYNAKNVDVVILNRWGEVVYESIDQVCKWDGKYKDHECPEGVYFWKITYENTKGENKEKHGFVELKR